MSRTIRNRSTTPHNWVVRDNGTLYYKDIDPWGRLHGVKAVKVRRSKYRCESAAFRRTHESQYRAKVSNLVRTEQWDAILPNVKTGGWLTW